VLSRFFIPMRFFGLEPTASRRAQPENPGLRRVAEVAAEQGGHAHPLQRGPAPAISSGAPEL